MKLNEKRDKYKQLAPEVKATYRAALMDFRDMKSSGSRTTGRGQALELHQTAKGMISTVSRMCVRVVRV